MINYLRLYEQGAELVSIGENNLKLSNNRMSPLPVSKCAQPGLNRITALQFALAQRRLTTLGAVVLSHLRRVESGRGPVTNPVPTT